MKIDGVKLQGICGLIESESGNLSLANESCRDVDAATVATKLKNKKLSYNRKIIEIDHSIGSIDPFGLRIESLCSGFYSQTCSLKLNSRGDFYIEKMDVVDQGMLYDSSKSSFLRYSISREFGAIFLRLEKIGRHEQDSPLICAKPSKANAEFRNSDYKPIEEIDDNSYNKPIELTADVTTALNGKIQIGTSSGVLSSLRLGDNFYEVRHTLHKDDSAITADLLCSSVGTEAVAEDINFYIPPEYGRWCGLNHGGKKENEPPPIDGVDEVCMRHDLCYGREGSLDCRCDADLLRDMPSASAETSQGKDARNAAINYFSVAVCFCKSGRLKYPKCCGKC